MSRRVGSLARRDAPKDLFPEFWSTDAFPRALKLERRKEAHLTHYNELPFARRIATPAGPLDTALAKHLFQDHFDWNASYFADGIYVRKIISEEQAREDGLDWCFTGIHCDNDHVAVRKFKPNNHTARCLGCKRARKQRQQRNNTNKEAV